MPTFRDRLQHAWDAFKGRDPTEFTSYPSYAYSSTFRPDRTQFSRANIRTLLPSIFNRLAVDAAQIPVKHVRLDKDNNYIEDVDSNLNYALQVQANIDQTGRAFMQDAIMSMYDEGCIAIVPTRTTADPHKTSAFDIGQMRVGKITEWFPDRVRVNLYNDYTGYREDKMFFKDQIAIIENPFYAIMNEPNSILQQLVKTLNKLERSNEMLSSNKLDMLIQLPYPTRSEIKRNQAEERIKTIETQLNGSKFGIAYIDVSEKVIPLNRSLENNLWNQVTELMDQLYNELGLTKSIFDGTADEATMINYYNRSIEPTLAAICEGMKVKFLSKTAIKQHQSISFYREVFKLVPVTELAKIADTFTRNEIMTGNEIRGKMGLRPSKDPTANELRNKNLNRTDNEKPGDGQEIPDNNSSDQSDAPDLKELLNKK